MENINIKDLNNQTFGDVVITNKFVPTAEKLSLINDVILEKNITVTDGVVQVNRLVINIVMLIIQVGLYTNLSIDKSDISSYDLIKIYKIDELLPHDEIEEWNKLLDLSIQNILDSNTYKGIFGRFLFSFKNNIDSLMSNLSTTLEREDIEEIIGKFIQVIEKIDKK